MIHACLLTIPLFISYFYLLTISLIAIPMTIDSTVFMYTVPFIFILFSYFVINYIRTDAFLLATIRVLTISSVLAWITSTFSSA
ncbi:hypothetical protein ACE1TH_10470 [Shouchella sp. JSM 1781072]|uniref:hypothetical protein n=1 Tax=Bacillaceae TaxID=186817 RepID=UPI000C088626|nr:hypothetical protein [Bacillus sp. Marseille-P3800]